MIQGFLLATAKAAGQLLAVVFILAMIFSMVSCVLSVVFFRKK